MPFERGSISLPKYLMHCNVMHYFTPALTEFEADMARVEHLLNLLKSFRSFGASDVNGAGENGNSGWPEALALHTLSKHLRTDLPVLAGSLVLYIAGRFEYFVRQLVEAAIDEIVSRYAKFDDLPKDIKGIARSKILEVAQASGRYGFSELETNLFIGQLAKNLTGDLSPPTIPSRVFSITDANMKDRVLADLMKRVGMESFWKELGKQAPLKLFLDKLLDADTTAEAISRLNKIMDDRNQIAHPTAATEFPDPDQVLMSTDFLNVLAKVIVDVLSVHMNSMKPS